MQGGFEQAASPDDGVSNIGLRNSSKIMEGGFGQATSSDDGVSNIGLRKFLKKLSALPPSLRQEFTPLFEDFLHDVVKGEIPLTQAVLSTGGKRRFENETIASEEGSLGLKFLGEVSLPVLTGRVITGNGGNSLSVALVNKTTGQAVDCAPESFSKVEILILEANDDDNWSPENFNNRIIGVGDKKRPHFAKSNYICLKDGFGTLCNIKLGHNSKWMKNCKCRLGARMESFGGIKVQEALTESFIVSDRRSTLYKKHHPPSLSDCVWRLDNIGKDGAPCQRLDKEEIHTVREFLFLHYADDQALRQIVGAGAKNWKAITNHAETCVIDDKRMYLYYPMSESKTGVVFDVVGRLKGAIHNSHYVPDSNLSEDEQACAHKLRLSAFKYRNNRIPFNKENEFQSQNNIFTFDDEDAFLQQFPCRPSHVVASANYVVPEGSGDWDLPIFEKNIEYNHSAPGTSSQNVQPFIPPSGHPNNICHFSSPNMGQLYNPGSGVPNQSPSLLSPDVRHMLENVDEYISYFAREK